MGLCKCQKITELYCFACRKAVCEQCIAAEHEVCYIGTYTQWIRDSDYAPPRCPVCRDPFRPGNAVRFPCLHLIHPECLEVYAASFPPDTAVAGFVCQTCSHPFLPTAAPPRSPISERLVALLADAPWLPLGYRLPAPLAYATPAAASPRSAVVDVMDMVASSPAGSRGADSRQRSVGRAALALDSAASANPGSSSSSSSSSSTSSSSSSAAAAASSASSAGVRATLQQLGIVEQSDLPLFAVPGGGGPAVRIGSPVVRRRLTRVVLAVLAAVMIGYFFYSVLF